MWVEYKRTVALIYDFLEEQVSKIKIMYNGDSSFQILIFTKKSNSDIENDMKSKFPKGSGVSFNVLKNSNQFKLYSINITTGLVTVELKRGDLIDFKKKDCTIDKVYKKITNKGFDWKMNSKYKKAESLDWKDRMDIIKKEREERKNRVKKRTQEKIHNKIKSPSIEEAKPEESYQLKNKISKVVQDYFSYVHDQLDDIYQGVNIPFKEHDRDEGNFYQQVRKVIKKKKSDAQALISNPAYVGDLIQYISNRSEKYKSKKQNQNKIGDCHD